MDYPEHRVLSGVQPSGTLHLGNYFGAIKQHVEMQEQHPGECFYFIADYHALTTVNDADKLRGLVRDVAVVYLSLGLDPNKALLFRQSDVPEVTELTWLLSTVTGMGLLERGTSYKDKIARGIKPRVGLFTYPVLMAADILAYGSSFVPVGKDQVQHVEFAQDMATHFNTTYSEVLRRPEYKLSKTPYVPGTDGAKMSKSYGNTIPIFETPKRHMKLAKSIKTATIEFGDPMDPDDCKVFALLKLFCGEAELAELRGWYLAGRRDGNKFGYGGAKEILGAKIASAFAEANAKREELVAHPEQVDQVLEASGQRAKAVARATVDACLHACGLR